MSENTEKARKAHAKDQILGLITQEKEALLDRLEEKTEKWVIVTRLDGSKDLRPSVPLEAIQEERNRL